MDNPSGFAAVKSALGNRNFRLYTSGNVLSQMGTWVQRIAIGWLTWQLTHSAFWLGIMSFCDIGPALLLAPLAGAVADRVERIRAIKITQSLAMAQAVILAALDATGLITIESLFLLALALGVINAVTQPLRLAVVPGLVERKDLPAAISINSLSFNGSRVIGPAIAGVLIVQWGVAPCFAVNAISFLAFLIGLYMMEGKPQDRGGTPGPVRNLPLEIAEGFGYCIRHAGIGPLLVMISFTAVFGRAYSQLLPGFAGEVFGRGADGLAMLTSSMGIGAVIAGALMARRGRLAGLTRIVTSNLLVLAVSVLGFTMSPSIWVALPCIMLSGYAAVTVSVGQQTLLQSAVTGSMRGRVMSIYGMIARGGPSIGALIMGALHGPFGLRWPIFAGAAGCLLVWAWIYRRRARVAAALEASPEG